MTLSPRLRAALAGTALVALTAVTLPAQAGTASTSLTARAGSQAESRAAEQSAEQAVRQGTTLRTLAAQVGLRVGTAVDPALLVSDGRYRAITRNQFSTVTAENVMKWQLTEPERGRPDWRAADRLVSFAQANGQAVRGHVLVWHSQNPDWVDEEDFTKAQLRAILKKHVTDEVRHFRGKVWAWDVVNEAFEEDGTLRDTLWLRALGPDYIAEAFRWAHAADPSAVLYYNDYNIEGIGPKSDATYELVRRLRAEGVPVEGVGFQTHLSTQYPLPNRMQENLARFAALGVDVAVTEADVRVPMPVDGDDEQRQVEAYRTTMEACLAVRRCVSYTVWGVGDANSWVPGVFPGEGWPLLWNDDLRPKAAFTALQKELAVAPLWAQRRPGTGTGAGSGLG